MDEGIVGPVLIDRSVVAGATFHFLRRAIDEVFAFRPAKFALNAFEDDPIRMNRKTSRQLLKSQILVLRTPRIVFGVGTRLTLTTQTHVGLCREIVTTVTI